MSAGGVLAVCESLVFDRLAAADQMDAVGGKEGKRLSEFIDFMTVPADGTDEDVPTSREGTNVIELAAWVQQANSMMGR